MPLVPTETDLLLQFLSERDTPCPVCGYNVRAATSARCPECGRALQLGVAVDERVHLPWTLAVIACASTVFFTLMFAFQLPDGLVNFTWSEWAIGLICSVLSIAVIPLLLLRRAIIAWRPRLKWALAATAGTLWLLAAGSIVVGIVTGA
jgi:hypothetical protein